MNALRPASSVRPRVAAADLLVTGMLLLCGASAGWPAIFGGAVSYLDNPSHLAEIHDLAGEARSGWCEIAWCGSRIGSLQSPLWYGLLGGWTRLGISPEPLYAALLWLAFCLPALALYFVARRRAAPLPAAVVSYLFLVQRPAIAGNASTFGGMWTFSLAAAAFILLADRLARPGRTWPDGAWIAILAALIVLTHSLVAVALVYLVLLHFIRTAVRGRLAPAGKPPAVFLVDAAALLVAALASARYWLPNLMSRASLAVVHWDLTPGQLAAMFLLPSDLEDLLFHGTVASARLFYTDALPLLLIPAAGCAGAALLIRDRRRRRGTRQDERTGAGAADPLPLYGLALALLTLVLLIVVVPQVRTPILGTLSWRQLYFVRLGLAFGAFPLLGWWRRPSPGCGTSIKRPYFFIAALAVASGFWWGTPLRDQTPPFGGPEMAEVRSLWRWMAANRKPDWGRVYLQDTFLNPPTGSRLARSHVLALTAHETGVRQMGGTYGGVPFPTSRWTNDLVSVPLSPPGLDYLLGGMEAANCTHVVVSNPEAIAVLASDPRFRMLWRSARFGVFQAVGIPSAWVSPGTEGLRASALDYRAGRIAADFDARGPGGILRVKESYHPFWKLEGPPGARFVADPAGLMRIENLPAGSGRLLLVYEEPRAPLWISLGGWLLAAAWLVAGPRLFARSRPA